MVKIGRANEEDFHKIFPPPPNQAVLQPRYVPSLVFYGRRIRDIIQKYAPFDLRVSQDSQEPMLALPKDTLLPRFALVVIFTNYTGDKRSVKSMSELGNKL